jgi:putative FmdB family regulatory protein
VNSVPTYVYKAKEAGCGLCRDTFERKQSMNDPPLERCPECGGPVERVICAPFLRTGRSDKSVLADDNLKKHGFTKLINEGGGKYRKTW